MVELFGIVVIGAYCSFVFSAERLSPFKLPSAQTGRVRVRRGWRSAAGMGSLILAAFGWLMLDGFAGFALSLLGGLSFIVTAVWHFSRKRHKPRRYFALY